MNEKIFNHVKKYWETEGYGTPSEEDAVEIIRESDQVWKGNEDSHRWWTIYTFVVEIDGMFIGFEDAVTTGDMSAREAGYTFDVDSICEYERFEKVIVAYKPKI